MQITVNGTVRDVEHQLTLEALLVAERMQGRRLAVEINGQIVPRSRHARQRIEPGDQVEIVHAIGGG